MEKSDVSVRSSDHWYSDVKDSFPVVPYFRKKTKACTSAETDGKTRTVIKTVLKEEIIHGEYPKTVVKYSRWEKFFQEGKPVAKIFNKVEFVKEGDSKDYASNSINSLLSIMPKNMTLPMDPDDLKEEPNKPTTKPETKVSRRKYLSILLFITLISLLIKYFNYFGILITTEPIRMKELQDDLSNNVLSQNPAIRTILHSIDVLRKPSKKVVITCLIGPSGVGKTYSINILKKHVDPRVVHMFQPEDLKSSLDLYNQYKKFFSDYTILVFENLKYNDLEQLKHFIQALIQTGHRNILIIPIFNIHIVDSYLNFSVNDEHSVHIEQTLQRLSKHFYMSEFNELDEATVRDWIRYKLIANNVNRKHQNNIISELLERQNVKSFGLKGILGKLLLKLISTENKLHETD